MSTGGLLLLPSVVCKLLPAACYGMQHGQGHKTHAALCIRTQRHPHRTPCAVVNKTTAGAFISQQFRDALKDSGAETLIVMGVETD